jgi:hypothetical protein
MEPRAPSMLGKSFTAEPQFQFLNTFILKINNTLNADDEFLREAVS